MSTTNYSSDAQNGNHIQPKTTLNLAYEQSPQTTKKQENNNMWR